MNNYNVEISIHDKIYVLPNLNFYPTEIQFLTRSSYTFCRTLNCLPTAGWFFFFQAEDGIRDHCVTGVQTCAFFFQTEDGIRDHCVTGVQTCALPIQAEDGIRDHCVTGVQTCALPISQRPDRRAGRDRHQWQD